MFKITFLQSNSSIGWYNYKSKTVWMANLVGFDEQVPLSITSRPNIEFYLSINWYKYYFHSPKIKVICNRYFIHINYAKAWQTHWDYHHLVDDTLPFIRHFLCGSSYTQLITAITVATKDVPSSTLAAVIPPSKLLSQAPNYTAT